ncbi:hypothetical protein BKA62DRAFT_723976 [Auriculariales sp. MPI-PUGE-AT-0066]|nr:hypothetical protein BKA62DRAFT_723976 [Auriculariales sp. MPI-PUGE-AT-0066]
MDIGVDFGLVYHINDAHQFWAELEDTVKIPDRPTLSQLDGRLRLYISLCATYHQQYLQAQMQLEHAVNMLLASELFEYHSDRMSNLLLEDAVANTNPHQQLVMHKTLLLYGRVHQPFLRSKPKWAPLLPILMDHVLVSIDFDALPADRRATVGIGALSMPIEARLMTLAVGILYEVCRVQKFDIPGLHIFDNQFIETLFDLVEDTRNLADETLNYNIIKLLLALNEQFMVAALPSHEKAATGSTSKSRNRVLQILIGRGAQSKTFAENVIFMLNRAELTEEDLCMQLLVLKVLYLLFTTRSTHEYFYTNDLCVLVDVFLRALANLPDESEALRHTYLRVLHPLLTNTQLRLHCYKRVQIVHTLQSLLGHANIRDISPTTKRLVERCLAVEWCKEFVTVSVPVAAVEYRRGSDATIPGSPTSPTSVSSFSLAVPSIHTSMSSTTTKTTKTTTTKSVLAPPATLKREKSLRSSASASDLKAASASGLGSTAKRRRDAPPVPLLAAPRSATTSPPHNNSMANLAAATTISTPPKASTSGKGTSRSGAALLGVQHPTRGVSLGAVADTLHAFSFDDVDAVNLNLDSDSSSAPSTPPLRRPRGDSVAVSPSFEHSRPAPPPPLIPMRAESPALMTGRASPYRPAPPPPAPGLAGHRRKAPAPPVRDGNGNGHSMTTIARSRAVNAVL